MEFSTSYSYPFVNTGGCDDHLPIGELHPDIGHTELWCYDRPCERPDDDVFRRIYPTWGNSGRIHLEAVVNLQLADTAGQMSRQAKVIKWAWNHPDRQYYDSFVVPLIDNRSGTPAGSGPCMEVTRAG